MPSPETVSIASGPLSARLRPGWGGRMTHLRHAVYGDIVVPTADLEFRPFDWPRAGAYPLFPYHNRLYGGTFIHAGTRHRLRPHPALAPDAMHGPAHRRRWDIAGLASDSVGLALDYEEDADWPFSFRAEQFFSLEENCLTVSLSITNLADRPAPAALGWHPYFAAGTGCDASTDARLQYPLDARNVPTGDMATPRTDPAIPATTGYTLHFCDWSKADVQCDDFSLSLSADPIFGHLAVHRMDRYLCLEPVSMVAGALGMAEGEREKRGVSIVSPGERLSGSIRLTIRPR